MAWLEYRNLPSQIIVSKIINKMIIVLNLHWEPRERRNTTSAFTLMLIMTGNTCMLLRPERRAVPNPAFFSYHSKCLLPLLCITFSLVLHSYQTLHISCVYFSSFVLGVPFLCQLLPRLMQHLFLSLDVLPYFFPSFLPLATNIIDKGPTNTPHGRRSIHDNLPLLN